jgi:hypothetical protein
MKTEFDSSIKQYDVLREDIIDLRTSAEDAMRSKLIVLKRDITDSMLAAINPILNQGTSPYYYAKGSETRTLLEELTQDRANGLIRISYIYLF